MAQRPAPPNAGGLIRRFFLWLVRSFWWVLDKLTTLASGEFVLKLGSRLGRPNGGTMIFLRSVWVSAIVYSLALLLHSGDYANGRGGSGSGESTARS